MKIYSITNVQNQNSKVVNFGFGYSNIDNFLPFTKVSKKIGETVKSGDILDIKASKKPKKSKKSN